jgi:hypothetical protein
LAPPFRCDDEVECLYLESCRLESWLIECTPHAIDVEHDLPLAD